MNPEDIVEDASSYYDNLVKSKDLALSKDSNNGKESLKDQFNQVDLDVNRTCPTHTYFIRNGGVEKLRRVQ